MLETNEYKGVWKIPNSDIWLPGTLTYSGERGASLNIQGSFTRYSRIDQPIILGKTTAGPLTLANCYDRGTRIHNEITITEYGPSYIIEGVSINSLSEANFSAVQFQLQHLHSWLNISGLENPFDAILKNTVNIKYNRPSGIAAFEIFEGCRLEVELGYDIELSHPNNQVNFQERVTAIAKYEKPRHFLDIIKDIYVLQTFLSFSVNEIAYIQSMDFLIDGTPHKFLFKSPVSTTNHDYIHPALHLLKYESINQDFQKIIKNWYTFFFENEYVVHLLMNSIKLKRTISEDRFMDLCRALELFHRSVLRTTPRPQEVYQSRVDEILSKLQGKLRRWCKDNLMRNSHSLQTRLIELYEKYGIRYIIERIPEVEKDNSAHEEVEEPTLSDFPKRKLNVESFFAKIANTRNFYTHYDEEINPDVFRKAELYSPIKLLTVLLLSCLFSHVGVEKANYESNFNDSTIT